MQFWIVFLLGVSYVCVTDARSSQPHAFFYVEPEEMENAFNSFINLLGGAARFSTHRRHIVRGGETTATTTKATDPPVVTVAHTQPATDNPRTLPHVTSEEYRRQVETLSQYLYRKKVKEYMKRLRDRRTRFMTPTKKDIPWTDNAIKSNPKRNLKFTKKARGCGCCD